MVVRKKARSPVLFLEDRPRKLHSLPSDRMSKVARQQTAPRLNNQRQTVDQSIPNRDLTSRPDGDVVGQRRGECAATDNDVSVRPGEYRIPGWRGKITRTNHANRVGKPIRIQWAGRLPGFDPL